MWSCLLFSFVFALDLQHASYLCCAVLCCWRKALEYLAYPPNFVKQMRLYQTARHLDPFLY